MSETGKSTEAKSSQQESGWFKRFGPLFGVAGVLLVMTLVYLGYDFLTARAQPCEAIFRQTAIGLSTKISFLKTEGELEIGREPLTDLTERAQMTALNLKTCCLVLDSGRLDPEQFLQCKSKARAYDRKIDEIVTVVSQAKAQEAQTQNTTSASNTSEKPKVVPAAVKAKLKQNVAAAKEISKAFNKEVVQVRKAQAIEQLEIVPPKNVDISAKEQEPNNDSLNTNVVALDKWITAAIGAPNDGDVFSFTTPPDHRDWITIELQNRSTTLRPKITLFSAQKAELGSRYNTTLGGDTSYQFVAPPNTQYAFRVTSYYGEQVGAYLVRVIANKSYDALEPNGDILSAAKITAGKVVKASIMDGGDRDYFVIEGDGKAGQVSVKLTNTSQTLRPHITIYDENKSALVARYNTTGGADVVFAHKIAPGRRYFLAVRDYYNEVAGAYELTVDFVE